MFVGVEQETAYEITYGLVGSEMCKRDRGYTSPGSGTSVVNVRLNCPPEVTIHTLTRGPDSLVDGRLMRVPANADAIEQR